MKLPKTYENEVLPLDSSKPPSLIYGLSEADFAPLATGQGSASEASTQLTSRFTHTTQAERDFILKLKADSQALIAANSSSSKSNTQTLTSESSSNKTTTQPSSTSKGIPSGPEFMDSSGSWELASPKDGFIPPLYGPSLKLPPEPAPLLWPAVTPSESLMSLSYAGMTQRRHGALDKQIGGTHYKDFPIQPVEFIHRNNIGFIEGCMIKYICRWRAKGGVQDLLKVKHYAEMLIELASGDK